MSDTINKEKKYSIPYEYKLKFPIEVTNETTIDTIIFKRRLNAGDMATLNVGDDNKITPGMMYPIMAGMTGHPVTILEMMDWQDDMSHCIEVVSSFL